MGDKIREIAGTIYDNYGGVNMTGSGAFYYGIQTASVAGGSAGRYGHVIFNASRVVPVGSQNSPATFSVIIWRRIT